MHPFCCVPADHNINNNNSMPATSSSLQGSDSSKPIINVNNHQNHNQNHNHLIISSDVAMRLSGGDQRDVKINDIVGNGIRGVLHKWVNYGKGWRPRWFVLQDGVLSYYKIHGPDKIIVSKETEKGSRVIGDDSFRRLARHRNNSNLTVSNRNPVGEVHLKVSSIRESRSDDKRFSIFTGTKRLHLRADTRDDRIAWMEALQAVKGMFPRISNNELMAPVGGISVSTEKLRQRLLEEG
ncbi:hypothetical protein OSB04_000910 [Centaurea solstitialis]|uniref:PH domain-containing protein n=1 Tax=Centaurea solstitialis TaxID=347529 RepID=A0AA38TQA8_9ASTR|nr:hypothetical protein OSB04_000910 [Centaurea solstitialis]